MAATRALIRRGVKRLHLVTLPTSTLQADLLVGAGCIATLETSAVSLGEFDFKLPLIEGLSRTLLNDMSAYPPVLSANLANRAQTYPHPDKPNESMIGDLVIAGGKNGVPSVGIVAVTGASVEKAVQGAASDKFEPNDAAWSKRDAPRLP